MNRGASTDDKVFPLVRTRGVTSFSERTADKWHSLGTGTSICNAQYKHLLRHEDITYLAYYLLMAFAQSTNGVGNSFYVAVKQPSDTPTAPIILVAKARNRHRHESTSRSRTTICAD